ncbi:protease inhibitor I42 family protein [Azohydromonas aeria]|uniref:protease inhibitor I42 family protein n=1 Tax=Azohydromonas aeria TaxID=2590212 RepID=UPI0035C04BC8
MQLPGSPSTGHAWLLRSVGSPVVELAGGTFEPAQALQPGAAGPHLCCFQSREPGKVQLRLELQQHWQPGTVAQSFELTVRVVAGRPSCLEQGPQSGAVVCPISLANGERT